MSGMGSGTGAGDVLAFAMAAVAAVLLVPSLVFTLETLVGSLSRRSRSAGGVAQAGPRARVAVLMPAHDEAGGIGKAIAAVLPQLRPADRLLVVADNCSDATAQVAAACGAQVVERHDTALRGKGHALAHGVRHLACDPPEIVVILDADCRLHHGAIDALLADCRRTGRPAQALYLMHAPTGAALSMRVAEFAWAVKNFVRPLGLGRLGLPCQLTGSGMAFPWRLIADARLATSHLVEDMQLGLELAGQGAAPVFCAHALVSSDFPTDAAAVASQRTRWEYGHFDIIRRTVPAAVAAALRQRRPHLLAMALDVCVPPLTSLVLVLVVCWLAAAATMALTGHGTAWWLASVALGSVVMAVLAAWWRHGRTIVRPTELAAIARYVAAKLPIYGRLLGRRGQTEWVRTKRDDRP